MAARLLFQAWLSRPPSFRNSDSFHGGSNPGGRRHFASPSKPALEPIHPPTQWVPGSLPWAQRQQRGLNHSPSIRTEVKERIEINLNSGYGPSRPLPGRNSPLPWQWTSASRSTAIMEALQLCQVGLYYRRKRRRHQLDSGMTCSGSRTQILCSTA